MPGHRALHERVTDALDTCVESQAVDFKESAPWDAIKFKLTRTAMAMGNLRDGGLIVIGVSERGTTPNIDSIKSDQQKLLTRQW